MSSFLEKMKQQKLLSVLLLLFTLVLGIVLGTLINTSVKASKDGSAIAADATPITVPQASATGNEFSKLAKRLEASVVYIHSDYLVKPEKRAKKDKDEEDEDQGAEPAPKDPQEMLKRFFGQQGAPQKPFRQEGSGTGFIVDKNGYIITNDHVVNKADRIKVRLINDDNEYRAHVVGVDPESDIAIIKVDAKRQLPPVQIGNSDGVEVGDWAVAIGAPFGLEATVTAGIVSATGRDLPNLSFQQQFQHFIQTDAAINPGNSGGPLLNIRGEVIGINTMIATRSGAYEGIGFALPSNMAARVYNDIIRYGRVVRGSIGVNWRPSDNRDTLLAFGLDHGVIVESAPADKPAGKAGVKEGDVVLALNDRPVKDGNDLVGRVADMTVGSVALLSVDRDGKHLDFKVPIGERSEVWKDQPQFAMKKDDESAPLKGPSQAKFGIGISRLTDADRQKAQLETKTGVRVASVDPGSFADDIGLAEGDVILSINRQDIGSPEDVLRIQQTLKPSQPVAFRVLRTQGQGQSAQHVRLYVSGRLPAE
jgi:serine protease Do